MALCWAALTSQPAEAVRVGPLLGWWGPVDHHVGSLYRVTGQLAMAEIHLRRALVVEERMGARPFLARTRGELARVLSATGSPEAGAIRAAAEIAADSTGAAGIRAEVTAPSLTR